MAKKDIKERIKASVAARMLGCTSKTVIRNSFGFQLARLKPDVPNSPYVVYRAEVEDYIARTRK